MPPETRPFDAARHLETPEDMALFLSDALEEGDPAAIRQALNIVARARGMTEIARAAGLGRESLYRSLGENGNPEFVTVLKVLRALGLTLQAKPA